VDRVREKKVWNRKRILIIVTIVFVLGLILLTYFSMTGKSKVNASSQTLTVSVVTKGNFQEFIPINGNVLPITTIYLDVIVGGRVEEKLVEDGARVKKGEPVIRLSNTDVELQLSTQETEVRRLITDMQQTRNQAQQNSIVNQNTMAEVDAALANARRDYFAGKKLHDQKVIADSEFARIQVNYNFQLKRKNLAGRTVHSDTLMNSLQLTEMNLSAMRSAHALQLMREKEQDLIVRAPVDGQLTSLNADLGQSIREGTRIGQIDVLSGFKVRADIDEFYISRVFPGLTGEFDFNDSTYKLQVTKIFSQVSSGKFQIDLAFTGRKPTGIRRGQNLQIRLALGDKTQAVLLPKGGFYQQTGGNWIFKVSASGDKAYKVNIKLGRQNPDYYEVTDGLQTGDKVITSSYENFGDNQELVIKK